MEIRTTTTTTSFSEDFRSSINECYRMHGLVSTTSRTWYPTLFGASSDEDTPPHQWPEDEEETDGENPPTCIQSLRRLEISGTSITPLGIHMILAASPIIAIVS